MSKMNIVRRCHACGCILQSENPNEEGYITPEVLENTTAFVLFCNKCFEESRYNFMPRTPSVTPDFLCMMQDAEASDALIVLIIDIFSFENSFVPEVTELIQGLKMLIVANKRDLLPASVPDEDLREYVAHRCRNACLRVTRDDVILSSLTSMGDVTEIANEIEKRRQRHDVYLVGAIGAGKSKLISSILHAFENQSRKNIVSSNYPGTSLRVLQIPLDSSSSLYETPGTSIDNKIESKLDYEGVLAVIPEEPIKARAITLDEGDCLFIGGVARIELLKGAKTDLKCYFSSKVSLSKARGKLAEDTFFRKAASGAIHPSSPKLRARNDFDAFDIAVEEKGRRDIGVSGLGWVCFDGNEQTFRVYTPKNVAIYTTRAKIK